MCIKNVWMLLASRRVSYVGYSNEVVSKEVHTSYYLLLLRVPSYVSVGSSPKEITLTPSLSTFLMMKLGWLSINLVCISLMHISTTLSALSSVMLSVHSLSKIEEQKYWAYPCAPCLTLCRAPK